MKNYWLIFLLFVFGIVVIVVAVEMTTPSLNNIKSRTVGDGQCGTARFSTQAEINKAFTHVPFTPELWRKGINLPTVQGLIIGNRVSKTQGLQAMVDSDDIHALVIAAAGAGKTAYFLYPNLEYACASGMSFLTTDTKGDLFKNYAPIAKKHYGYNIAVIDLRNPTQSDGYNLLNLVNKYMDDYEVTGDIRLRTKAEKYAKIISKTIIASDGDSSAMGANVFFYDAAEGLLTATILLIAEFGEKNTRHIVSVFKMIQDLLQSDKNSKTTKFAQLLSLLPEEHKARWFAGSALSTAQQTMQSVLSTALSRLNSFLDSEMEQILCFDTAIDAEKFCNTKSAIFIVMPEEDNSKYFFVSLIVQQLYREILSVADETDGVLLNRIMFYLDEIGTIPKIASFEMMFSASRSRRMTLVPLIQSLAQFVQNYGKEGTDIIVDNCQVAIFGGFAPNSTTAEVVSKNLGDMTVMTGSVTTNNGATGSKNLQMTNRPLMSTDELKTMPKGDFIVMKTGINPVRTKYMLFTKWGIKFEEQYAKEQQEIKTVAYINEADLIEAIMTNMPTTKIERKVRV